MEDINAKRDARRRRILENSERRLLKITGRNGNTRSEDTSSQYSFPYSEVQTDISQANVNGAVLDRCNDEINTANVFNSDDIWNSTSTTFKNRYDTRTEVENIHCTPNYTKLLLPGLLTSRINYILLAFVVNILLVLEVDYLFGKTIAIPYFPIMMGRLYSCKNTQETQNGSLLYAALILCNIKPELTYQLKKIVSMIHMILGDLALYIFSFTLTYYAFLYYFHETDILINLNV
ncbi:uncharacterized protein LOC128892011 [Hylaeus anthracinus]|uniref:uncharacterized protein LOC128892011 n=1 Tax=Hylaeus anthracinus TaxID=313031 RepID=UPI0023B8BD6B|nr:uncharacterized protein LOC128892011 [Hylaeus anthracinus]